MSEEVRITLHLNDALYNAGILGFLRVLEKGKISYELSDQIISFSSDEMIDKFTNAYFDTLLAMYGSETGAYRFCEALANLSRNGIKVLSPVLPEVQAREHDRCQKFYHQGQTARRKDAVLIAKPIMRCVSLF